MAELIEKNGGHIYLNSPVEEIIVDKGIAKGLRVNGEAILFDEIIINADFAYAMNHLIKPAHLNKYTPLKLQKKKYSVSTFMLYIGLDKEYDFAHHEILFSDDYEAYLKGLTSHQFTDDFSVYVHNPGRTDDSYAPKGHTSLFVLVPVPNTQAKQDWTTYKEHLKEKTLDLIESKHGVDLRNHIQVLKMLDPTDWEKDYHVHFGAVFNMAHNLPQMLHRRPHNQFEDISHVYLVGGGTHPGSGLPTIYQSALILKHYL
jgi:phytoene desaturase